MRLLFVIPTNGGPLVVTALRPRPGLQGSVAFAEGDFRGLPWSAEYAELCKPGGALAGAIPQLAPHELRLSGSFDTGRSWEAPIALAHLMLARGHTCAARPAEAEAIIWTTGAIDLDLAPIGGDYALSDKIEKTAALLAGVPETTPIFVILPPAPDVEAAWTRLQAIANARPVRRIAAAPMTAVAALLQRMVPPDAAPTVDRKPPPRVRWAGLLGFLGAVVFALALTGAPFVLTTPSLSPQVGTGDQRIVKVGVIYPFSTSIGTYAKAAIAVAEDIINNHPELAKSLGLTHRGDAKIKVVRGDSKGDPATGADVAVQLIKDEKVVALNGAYHSNVTKSASAAAERYQIPFLTGDSVADELTERGFQWFFSTTPVAADFASMYAEFLKDMKAKRYAVVDHIAIVHEDTQYGVSVASAVSKTFKDNGLNITLVIPYPKAGDESVAQQLSAVQRLKDKQPDVVMFISYTNDAIRFAQMMMQLKYRPRMVIADDAGFSDPAFISAVGNIVQRVLIRSSWSAGAPGTRSYVVNEMYKKISHVDLDNTSARILQGFMVLADAAINREPLKIRAALKATDLKPDQLIVRYNGVNFDQHGQNKKASVMLTQLQGLEYLPVWPEKESSAKLQLPYKGW